MRYRSGFTLVEILLVTALTAGISLAIFICLSNGLKLWDRSRILMVEDDTALFFDRFSSDIRNAFPLSTLSFEGNEFHVSFPTIVMTKADQASSRSFEGTVEGLGRVQYFFDIGRQALMRRQANYSQALRDTWGDEREIVKGISRVRFKYFAPGSVEPRFIHEVADIFPAGVEVEITLMSGDSEKTLKRFVAIPAGL